LSRIGEFSVKRKRGLINPLRSPDLGGRIGRLGTPQTPVRLRRTAPAQHSLIQPPWSPTPPEASASGGLGDDIEMQRGFAPLHAPVGTAAGIPIQSLFSERGIPGRCGCRLQRPTNRLRSYARPYRELRTSLLVEQERCRRFSPAGSLRVSLNSLLSIPHEWGIKGVEHSLEVAPVVCPDER